MTQWIEDALRELGVTAKYFGFRRAVLSIKLAIEDENRLSSVTKEIYQVVGDLDHCTWKAVERALRTIVTHAWKNNPRRLSEMARRSVEQAPTAADFLDIMSNHIRRTYLVGTNGREHL